MKAITLHQPWATLVAFGFKTIETRTWPAPSSLIGERIAIHAAGAGRIRKMFHTLPLGCVVATAVLTEVVPTEWAIQRFPDQLPFGDYTTGRFAWLLDDVVAFDRPVKASGKQGFWEWTP
jgi:hypothetical protein